MSGIEGPGIIGGGGGGGGAPTTATYITLTDETATLPNSQVLGAELPLAGPESLSGAAIISPAALAAGTTNDWSPTGLATARQIRVTTNNAGSSLSGIDASVVNPGALLTLENIGPTGDLNLLDQNAGSTAANRFIGIVATDIGLPVGDSITLFYDSAVSRWRKA